MDHTLALIMKSQQGDKEARDTVFKENAGLVYSMAKRFAGRSVEMEDIVQIGSIGLLKAIDRFDISYDVKFSTYAVPMIIGEIRRFLRDNNSIRVSRSLRDTAYKSHLRAGNAFKKEPEGAVHHRGCLRGRHLPGGYYLCPRRHPESHEPV